MLQGALMGSAGASFLRKAKTLKRPVFAWTVNDAKSMRWCISEELDGVISDEPKDYLDVCRQWQRREDVPTYSLVEKFGTFRLRCLLVVYSWWYRWKYGGTMDKRFVQKS
jgi:phosphatidylglycerol phospholipase C